MKFLTGLTLVSGVSALSPVTRVAELLEGLSKQVEKDGKTEQKLYLKYRCWFEKTGKEKDASNQEATARIESLASYIDDIENGRVEFTTERQDLEKQLATINAQLEKAKQIREQEKADFEAASEEMKKGIKALEGAIAGIVDATKDGSLLSKKFDVRRALLLSKSALGQEDYKVLVHALDEQPEKKDWEKLNKKGDFKEKYSQRSTGIEKTLNELLQTFEGNLKSAEDKEKKSSTAYTKLKEAKEDEKDATQQALTDMKGENAARAMNLEEAKTEKKNLEDQVAADTKFMSEATATFEKATEAYNARKSTRADELAAISGAIGILRSDDARDLFKKSFDSQTNFFQLATSSSNKDRSVAQIMKTTRQFSHEKKFRRFLTKIRKSDASISSVIDSIDEMIKELKAEKEEDLKKKQTCEDQFRGLMTDMKKAGLEIDDEQEIIETKTSEIAAAEDKIKECKATIKDTEEALQKAKDIRDEENAAFQESKLDDQGAVELLEKAAGVLSGFYQKKNAGSFLQLRNHHKQSPVPKFLREQQKGAYAGEKDEGGSIIATLDLIKADVEKDMAEAKEEEEAAQAAYDEFVEGSNTKIGKLEEEITGQEEVIGQATTDKTDAQKAKDQLHEELAALTDEYTQKEGHCNFYMLNFEARHENRKLEMDGLLKAKTILSGGEGSF